MEDNRGRRARKYVEAQHDRIIGGTMDRDSECCRVAEVSAWSNAQTGEVAKNMSGLACQASGSQPLNTIAFLAEKSDQLAGSQPWGTNLLRDCPAFRRQPQRVGPLLRSRRNSRSSTGAPLSRIIATVTPSEGEFGAVRISLPSIAA
jgi:hypothetical protein